MIIKCVISFILLNFILNCVVFNMHVSFCGSVSGRKKLASFLRPGLFESPSGVEQGEKAVFAGYFVFSLSLSLAALSKIKMQTNQCRKS